MSKTMWAIGLAGILLVLFGGQMLEGGMKFARLVQGHILMVDGKVPVTEEPCCCLPSPSPSPSPSLSPSLSLALSPSPSPSEFPGAGWYCISFLAVTGRKPEPVYTCADVEEQSRYCAYIDTQESFDAYRFGVCEDASDEFNFLFLMSILIGGPYAIEASCTEACM